MRIGLVTFAFVCLSFVQLYAQSPFGRWITVDEVSGEHKAIVEIYQQDGLMFGKIVDILVGDKDILCKECPGDQKNQPLLGMVIIKSMKQQGDTWAGGEILKPENGKMYDGKIWREGDHLMVRGYLGFLYKTQQWLPFKDQ
ncbi:DUF2147 domain-containing protein [Persicobacter psychrovividus]|uniref:DUF2147 domain-containing protein n=1 Tax=Persicobacter psychrovividus TaxID=387638 RepID=A0ABN6LEU4_9BACT|nr:hypothetical protein PEPS_39930 [Persicobacter psychrovividus]